MSHHLLTSPSRSGRGLASASLSSSFNERDELSHQGYLNRKSEGAMGKRTKTVLHRENRWQLLWCKLKGQQMEFYKVEGVRSKPGEPPPRDIYPPTNLMKTKVDTFNMGGAIVEIEYISEENKDIQKRRQNLFRVELDKIEYIMQASTNNQRNLWVSALQRASGQRVENADQGANYVGPGHMIKTVRDSIKHNRRQVQRTRSPGHAGSQSVSEDTDYIELSKAEEMIHKVQDPRLQALRKRLQAKKELLKQLDRMYSSFLGGSAAAMYDDSLILQQMEPPVFSNGHLSGGQGQPTHRKSKNKNSKVVHRTLAVSGKGSSKSISMDRGMDEMTKDGVVKETPTSEGRDTPTGRRASTGEMEIPAEVTRVQSPPLIAEDGPTSCLETELLTDYYLVPGANWSLVKKGERVQILGKAPETGWYRCMASRQAQIKLDHSAFSVLTMTTGAEHRKTRSYDERCMMSDDSLAEPSSVESSVTTSYQDLHQHELSGTSITSATSLSPLSRSCPPPVAVTNERAEIFHMEMMGGDSEQATLIEEEDEEGEVLEARSFGEDDEIVTGRMEGVDSFVMVNHEDVTESKKREVTRSPDPGSRGETSVEGSSSDARPSDGASIMREQDTTKNASGNKLAEDGNEEGGADGVGGADGEVVLRKNTSKVERPLSYKLATDEERSLVDLLTEAGVEVPDVEVEEVVTTGNNMLSPQHNRQTEKVKKSKRTSGTNIRRSTSTVTQSSQAAVTLRRTLDSTRGMKAQSSRVSSSNYSLPSLSSIAVARNSLLMWSRVDNLVKKELTTGSYPAPLIGCIPPSALKMFAGKEAQNGGSNTSPTHSHSENSDSNNSRPVSGRDSSPDKSNSDNPEAPPTSGSNDPAVLEQSSATQSSVTSQDATFSSSGSRPRGGTKSTLERSGSLPSTTITTEGSLTDNSGQFPRITCADSEEDSDSEADRRMAMMFRTHDTIDPNKDMDILTVKHKVSHTRTRSLPPPAVVEVVRDDEDESPPPPLPPRMLDEDDEGDNTSAARPAEKGAGPGEENTKVVRDVESSLDRSPSHMRKLLKKPGADPGGYPVSHSVGSSPAHKSSAPIPVGKGSLKPDDFMDSPSPGKSGLFKKLFNRSKTKLSPSQQPPSSPPATHEARDSAKLQTSAPQSGGLSPGLLKHVLLGQQEELQDEFGPPRLRMSSISGRPVRQDGMAILIGNETDSSDDSEEEAEEYNRYSNASSLQDDVNFSGSGLNISSREEDSTTSSPCNGVPASQENRVGATAEMGGAKKVRKPRGKCDGDASRTLPRDIRSTGMLGESKMSDLPESPAPRLKRSASDHDSLALKSSDTVATPTDPFGKPGSSSSLKRNLSSSSIVKMMVKKGSKSISSPSASPTNPTPPKKGRQSKKKKKMAPPTYELNNPENRLAIDSSETIKITGIIRQPPHGEKRFVYLDPSDGKFGFRLQSYGSIREQGHVLQTFVESVTPGTPAFMAGLYPGDAIVEVNGVDVKYAKVDTVVEEIKKASDRGDRILLKVEFVDGVTRLECMRKADNYKNEIKLRQSRLKELLQEEKNLPPQTFTIPSPSRITVATNLPAWEDTGDVKSGDVNKIFPYSRQLNQLVCRHDGGITGLQCDVLVMPISSCHRSANSEDKNLLLQLLKAGGPGLLDDLSLAKQCKIGDNIITWGHDLPTKYIYHCVFGDLEESLQSCCYKALETAHKEKLATIVFWLDGFAALKVSPHLVIESVRYWMQQDISRNSFQRVVFSSRANASLVQDTMLRTFPLGQMPVGEGRGLPSLSSPTAASEVSVTNGDVNGTGDDMVLDELDEVMQQMEGLVNSLSKDSYLASDKARSQEALDMPAHKLRLKDDFLKRQSLPQTNFLEDSANIPSEWKRRSLSPKPRSLSPGSVAHSYGSGDLVLNPDRTESEV